MARPLKERELYDADIQALLRVSNAVLLDDDISQEEQERIQEGVTYAVRVLRRVTEARRPEIAEKFRRELKERLATEEPPSEPRKAAGE